MDARVPFRHPDFLVIEYERFQYCRCFWLIKWVHLPVKIRDDPHTPHKSYISRYKFQTPATTTSLMNSFAASFADPAKRLPEPRRGEIEETPHLQRHAAARRVDQVHRHWFRLVSLEDDLQLAADNRIGNLIVQ